MYVCMYVLAVSSTRYPRSLPSGCWRLPRSPSVPTPRWGQGEAERLLPERNQGMKSTRRVARARTHTQEAYVGGARAPREGGPGDARARASANTARQCSQAVFALAGTAASESLQSTRTSTRTVVDLDEHGRLPFATRSGGAHAARWSFCVALAGDSWKSGESRGESEY